MVHHLDIPHAGVQLVKNNVNAPGTRTAYTKERGDVLHHERVARNGQSAA